MQHWQPQPFFISRRWFCFPSGSLKAKTIEKFYAHGTRQAPGIFFGSTAIFEVWGLEFRVWEKPFGVELRRRINSVDGYFYG